MDNKIPRKYKTWPTAIFGLIFLFLNWVEFEINFLEIVLYPNYKSIDVLRFQTSFIDKDPWAGSLFFLSWAEGDIEFDIFYLNGSILRSVS